MLFLSCDSLGDKADSTQVVANPGSCEKMNSPGNFQVKDKGIFYLFLRKVKTIQVATCFGVVCGAWSASKKIKIGLHTKNQPSILKDIKMEYMGRKNIPAQNAGTLVIEKTTEEDKRRRITVKIRGWVEGAWAYK